METKNWKDIWRSKTIENIHSVTLKKIIELDGFEGYGEIEVDEWIKYIDSITEKLNISNADSIFEIGCGAGAFLFPFYKNKHLVGGIDYSSKLIETVGKFMPKGFWLEAEASEPIDRTYDVVVSNSVFIYFSSPDYAQSVVNNMISMCNKSIAILDVLDLEKKEAYLNYKRRLIGGNYDQLYPKSLDQQFYSKDWFSKLFENTGFTMWTEDQSINGYRNSPYRFNVYAKKAI